MAIALPPWLIVGEKLKVPQKHPLLFPPEFARLWLWVVDVVAALQDPLFPPLPPPLPLDVEHVVLAGVGSLLLPPELALLPLAALPELL
jgi:hypothetical protein